MGGRDRILAKVVIGHDSSTLPQENEKGHCLRWKLFVRAVNDKKIEKNFISKIIFNLHETYEDKAERTLREAPFEVDETGYGSFNPDIRIFFAYPGAKPVKINYEMILLLADNSHHEQEFTFALKDCPASFLDTIRKYERKKKRESEESVKDLRDTLFPPVLKKPKLVDDSASARSSPKDLLKLSPQDGTKVSPKDKNSKEKDGSKSSPKDKEVNEKDRHKDKDRKEKKKEKKDKERDKEKSKDKKKEKHKEKDHEKKRNKDRAATKTPDEMKPTNSPKLSAVITPPPTLTPEPPIGLLSRVPTPIPDAPIVPPSRVPTIAPELPIVPPSRPKVAPIKCEDRKKPVESDSSSSMSISSPSSMGSPASNALTCVEIQRRISSLTNEEQIFKVACILLSCEGSQLLMPKLALSFDMDLSSADPSLIDRLSKALQ